MPVYVDKPLWKLGRMIMCHMVADTLGELHSMADRLGLKRAWFQDGKNSIPHYDISKAKRTLAMKFGAVEIGRKGLVGLIREHRNKQ